MNIILPYSIFICKSAIVATSDRKLGFSQESAHATVDIVDNEDRVLVT